MTSRSALIRDNPKRFASPGSITSAFRLIRTNISERGSDFRIAESALRSTLRLKNRFADSPTPACLLPFCWATSRGNLDSVTGEDILALLDDLPQGVNSTVFLMTHHRPCHELLRSCDHPSRWSHRKTTAAQYCSSSALRPGRGHSNLWDWPRWNLVRAVHRREKQVHSGAPFVQ